MSFDRSKITNEEYADIMIQYNGNENILKDFEGQSIYTLNSITAVLHLPVRSITNNVINQYGYAAMPLCYGTISSVSIEASGIIRARNLPNLNLRGEGVLIGIIDSGIDYTNDIFQYEDGTTRIVSIWDQTIDSDIENENTYYGTEYGREEINEALRSDDPYQVVASRDNVGHGTMVAGIAGGKDRPDQGFYGVATSAEFVVVKLKQAKKYLRDFFLIPDDSVCYQETDIISGIQYIREISRKLRRPLVTCIAVGTSQGAHDGSGMLDEFVRITSASPGVITTVAGGNEGNARRHFFGVIDEAIGYETVDINVGEESKGFSMEIWSSLPSSLSLGIQSPTGEVIPRISTSLDANRVIDFVFEDTIIYIDFQMIESLSGDQLILLRFKNPSVGVWRLFVYGIGNLEKTFNAWLPMQDFISDNTFFIKSNPHTTILSCGNVYDPITITAYNPENDSLYLNASKGFTRVGLFKPDLAAPGVNIIGPTLTKSFAPYTGTSVAVAHTSGIAAMMLEWSIVRKRMLRMNSLSAKKFLIRGARRNVNLIYPNRDWGYGIIDIFSSFEAIVSNIAGII